MVKAPEHNSIDCMPNDFINKSKTVSKAILPGNPLDKAIRQHDDWEPHALGQQQEVVGQQEIGDEDENHHDGGAVHEDHEDGVPRHLWDEKLWHFKRIPS